MPVRGDSEVTMTGLAQAQLELPSGHESARLSTVFQRPILWPAGTI